uniref:Uncharacterized protein n=1 Tax=Moniliophthora roreri TaxID=221103 RepID=A0A0W0G1V5_MONRR
MTLSGTQLCILRSGQQGHRSFSPLAARFVLTRIAVPFTSVQMFELDK